MKSIYDEALEEAIWHGEIEGPQTVEVIIKALERAKKVEEFIINCFIECDELGLEPTTLTNENGKEIVMRWRKELEELK